MITECDFCPLDGSRPAGGVAAGEEWVWVSHGMTVRVLEVRADAIVAVREPWPHLKFTCDRKWFLDTHRRAA